LSEKKLILRIFRKKMNKLTLACVLLMLCVVVVRGGMPTRVSAASRQGYLRTFYAGSYFESYCVENGEPGISPDDSNLYAVFQMCSYTPIVVRPSQGPHDSGTLGVADIGSQGAAFLDLGVTTVNDFASIQVSNVSSPEQTYTWKSGVTIPNSQVLDKTSDDTTREADSGHTYLVRVTNKPSTDPGRDTVVVLKVQVLSIANPPVAQWTVIYPIFDEVFF
jgi:hypothetical protein